MDEIKFPESLVMLGTMLGNPEVTLGDLNKAAVDAGMAIQYRIVPFSDVLHVLRTGIKDAAE